MGNGAILGQTGANRQLSNLSNTQRALNNIGAGVRPNLLDNWYFAGGGGEGTFPINQRGQTSYAVNNDYSIDRWRMDNYQNVLTVYLQSDCIKLQKTSATNNPGFYQVLSDQTLVGKTVTASVIYRGTGLSTVKLVAPGLASGYIFQDSVNWNLATATYTVATGSVGSISDVAFIGFQLEASITTSDYLEVLAIKLELGENQTLAYQDSDGNWILLPQEESYATEWLKCRHFFKRHEISMQPLVADGQNTVSIYVDDLPMRIASPSLKFATDAYALKVGGGAGISIDDGDLITETRFGRSFTILNSSLAVGQTYVINQSNSSNNFNSNPSLIDISADF